MRIDRWRAEASPEAKQCPQKLEGLFEDKRLPVMRRHLRKIYVNPLTGKPVWASQNTGIALSACTACQPLKTANFKT